MIDPFKKTAVIHGVSEKEVISEINKAIALAYENPTDSARNVPCKGEIPTAEEVFNYIFDVCLGIQDTV